MYLFRWNAPPPHSEDFTNGFSFSRCPSFSLSLSLSLRLTIFYFRAFSLPAVHRADGVSFRILAFDRVLGPVSVGVMIEREGYRALPPARPLLIRVGSPALLERSVAFAKSAE